MNKSDPMTLLPQSLTAQLKFLRLLIYVFRVLLLAGVIISCQPSPSNPNPPSPTPVTHPAWLSFRNGPGSAAETNVYYTAIGAYQTKSTLADWKNANGFSNGPDARAIYYNAGDLNLGRDMNCKQVGSKVACYVTNYGPDPANAAAWFKSPDHNLALQDAIAGRNAFATVAMDMSVESIPSSATVTESAALDDTHPEVDAGIGIRAGEKVTIDASGSIQSGVFATGSNGPAGWNNTDCDPKFPVSCSHPYALIGKFGSSGSYFYIGNHLEIVNPNASTVRLFLRTNDDSPGNGGGQFDVNITVERDRVDFYVYDGKGNLFDQPAVLDSEGGKNIPHICIPCHGGTYDSTNHIVSGASFLPFDLASFRYSPDTGWTQSDQAESFRKLNALVKASRPTPTIINFIDGSYPSGVENSGSTFLETYVPSGWNGQNGVYQNFITPYCRSCHFSQDSVLNPIQFDFMTYLNFKNGADKIRSAVCKVHYMPHAEIPFKKLFQGPLGAVPLLVLDDPNVLPPPANAADKCVP